jgi:hypothetical protein
MSHFCKELAKDPNSPFSQGAFRLQWISRFVSPLSYRASLGRQLRSGPSPFPCSAVGAIHSPLAAAGETHFLQAERVVCRIRLGLAAVSSAPFSSNR